LRAIFLILLSLSYSAQAKEPSCGDFLGQQKPSELTFKSCNKSKESQLNVLRATYQVAGHSAEKVEEYLMKTFNMPKLRFICCGWETLGSHGKYFINDHYVKIIMHSEESLIQRREKWNEISLFYIEAVLYLEES